jgi:integrase
VSEVIKKSELVKLPLLPLPPKIILDIESRPYSKHNLLEATNDLEAVAEWLAQYAERKTTFKSYQKESERLLLWCVYVAGRSLAELTKRDFEDYFKFLKKPPIEWCATRADMRDGRRKGHWRPFIGPLKLSALNTARRIITSLINYLTASEYVRVNPLKLIKKTEEFSGSVLEQKYNVWTRMLEPAEWQAVLMSLNTMPDKTRSQLDCKYRTQLLFAMLYFLGLRIFEVASHTWGAFQQVDGCWWFFVKGKGGKLGHIPVNDELFKIIKMYRVHFELPLEILKGDETSIFALNTGKPASIRALYHYVKTIGLQAAKSFVEGSSSREKLKKLSPHWLRHLSASHQDKLGISATMIQENLRHASIQTTNIYMHAENESRFSEIQKMHMGLNKIEQKNILPTKSIEIVLSISGGALCDKLALSKFLTDVEANVLGEIVFNGGVKDKSTLLNTFEKSYGRPIKILYSFPNITVEQVAKISQEIFEAANIRLLRCCID